MSEPTVVIVGPGAMGCGVAALLASKGADVSLLDHRPDRAAAIDRIGLVAYLPDGEIRQRVLVSASAAELAPADLVIVLVKAYSTRSAAEHLAPCVGPGTSVLSLQNGLGNYETLAEILPQEQVLAGTIVMGCTSLGPGEVRIAGIGEIVVGSPFGDYERALGVAALIARWWPTVAAEEDINPALWHKAIINAGVNPLTALTGLPNGALLEDPELRETLEVVVEESVRASAIAGVRAFESVAAAQAAVAEVCRLTAANRSSMLQDVLARRPTEIDQICGEIIRRSEPKGMNPRHLKMLTALVKGLERGYSVSVPAPSPGGGEKPTPNRAKRKTKR